MADGLPEGLVTNSSSIKGEIERVDRVAIEDVIQLWKVYSTNKAILADGMGRRLENLFWRIWNNPSIRDHIKGNQVAALFGRISEGGFLRTTPTQSPQTSRSPRSNRAMDDLENDAPSFSPTARPTSSPSHDRSKRKAKESTKAVNEPRKSSHRSTKEANLPPSILKKSRADSSTQLSKSTRILSPTFETLRKSTSCGSSEVVVDFRSGFSDATVTTRGKDSSRPMQASSARVGKKLRIGESELSPTSEASTTRDKSSKPQGDDSQKASRRKPAILAKTGASRRKPALARRKSSQSSSGNTSNITSPPSASKKIASADEPTNFSLEDEPPSRSDKQPMTRSSPHPSKHGTLDSQGETSSSDDEEESQGGGNDSFEDDLVDRDFRSKFASRIRPAPRPAGSLPPEGKSAQAAQASPFSQATNRARLDPANQRSTKGKRSVGFTDEIIPLKPPGASGPDEVDEELSSALPRTKSQLTLLLEKDRQTSKDENTGKKGDRR